MKRLGIALLILIGFGLMVMVYVTKTRTQAAAAEVKKLERTLENEEALIRTLETEIAYLERPDRIGEIAEEHLELRPTEAQQVITLDELTVRAGLRPDDEPKEEGDDE